MFACYLRGLLLGIRAVRMRARTASPELQPPPLDGTGVGSGSGSGSGSGVGSGVVVVAVLDTTRLIASVPA